jgi:hypothetical protein
LALSVLQNKRPWRDRLRRSYQKPPEKNIGIAISANKNTNSAVRSITFFIVLFLCLIVGAVAPVRF